MHAAVPRTVSNLCSAGILRRYVERRALVLAAATESHVLHCKTDIR